MAEAAVFTGGLPVRFGGGLRTTRGRIAFRLPGTACTRQRQGRRTCGVAFRRHLLKLLLETAGLSVCHYGLGAVCGTAGHKDARFRVEQTIKIVADIKESTLYPILKKLEKAGFVTTYTQEFQGRKRKYYTITPNGRNHIPFLQAEWDAYKTNIDGIIEGSLRK